MPLKSAKFRTLAAKATPIIEPPTASPTLPPATESTVPVVASTPSPTPIVEPPAQPPAPQSSIKPPSPIEVDPDLAELRAFRARYKAGGFPDPGSEAKKQVRAELVAKGISRKWSSYVARFGFAGEVAEAMLRTLEEPRQCHAGWFKEAEIAIRRAGLDLSTLDYHAIRGAIEAWRAERKAGNSAER